MAAEPKARLRRLHVGLLSGTLPMIFGPYASQLVLISNELQRRGHTISWISVNKNAGIPVPPEYNVTVLPLMSRKDNVGQPVYVSAINDFATSQGMDAIVSLMDLNRIFTDESFALPSIAWFPNHFETLDMGSRAALTAYDVVAALAPSDAARISQQLPHKRVVHVPHVIQAPPSAAAGQRALRRQYQVPLDAFVVFVTFANYDSNSQRKA